MKSLNNLTKFLLWGFLLTFAYSFSLSEFAISARIRNKPIYSGTWKGIGIEYVSGEFLVKIRRGVAQSQIDSLLESYNTSIIHEFNKYRWGLVGCDTTRDIFSLISDFRETPLIEYAEPNLIGYDAFAPTDSTPNDSLFSDHQWNLDNRGQTGGSNDADIDALEAWTIETGDTSVIIAVIDWGIPMDYLGNLTHPDLDDPDKYIFGYDYVEEDSLPNDNSQDSHGTKVLGIVGAETNNTSGTAGVCWHCRYRIIKRGSDVETWANAIRGAAENDVKIINCSFGQYAPSQNLEEAVAVATDSFGCLVVAAVHQYEDTIGGAYYPTFPSAYNSYGTLADTLQDTIIYHNKCCYHDSQLDSTICEYNTDTCGYRGVIAVANFDTSDRKAHGRGQGSNWSNDSMRVTVAGPGGEDQTCTTTNPENGYYSYNFGGTSAAAPNVSGIAGLLWSYQPILTADSIRTIVENTADDLESPGWDDSSGHGRANALRALMALQGYYPNASGHLKVDATWKDTIYMIGDVVVLDTVTLTIDSGTVIKVLTQNYEDWGVDANKCELIVKGKLKVDGRENHHITFTSTASTPSDTDWYGIRVLDTDSASAIIEYADIKYAYKGIDYANFASDTIKHCHFYHNQMYGIKANNSNLVIYDNIIEKDNTSDYLGYGIYTENSSLIRGNQIENYKYGIYAKQNASSLVDSNKITNGTAGVYCYYTNSFGITSLCFKGKFEDSYVRASHYSTLDVNSCYMDADTTTYGMWYSLYAGGTVRENTILNFQDYGIYCQLSSTVDLGETTSHGDNCVEGFETASRLVRNVEGKGGMYPIIYAEYNWWGTGDPEDSLFDTGVLWDPPLGDEPVLTNACSHYKGPGKIVSATPVAEKFSLMQNYPNPFNPTTVIRFTVNGSRLTENCPIHTTLNIYNILGQKVKTLVDEPKYPGTYQICWDGKDEKGQEVSSGIYFYRIKTDHYVEVKKMVLLK